MVNIESEAELRSVLTEQCSIEGARRLVEAIDRGEIEPGCYADYESRCGCIYFNLAIPEEYRDRVFEAKSLKHGYQVASPVAQRFIRRHMVLKPFRGRNGKSQFTHLELELMDYFEEEGLADFLAEVRAVVVEIYPELA